MKNNVLSLDIDLLFDGETYAKYIQHEVKPEHSWKFIYTLEDSGEYGVNTSLNQRALYHMVKILKEKCKTARVMLIDEHDEILPILKEEGESSVWNFDFHHDITYDGDDTECNIENWVRHGYAKGYISEYHWVARPMAEPCTQNILPYTKDNLEDISLDVLPNFDLVVVCISRHFTPQYQWSLLPTYLMRMLSNQHLNYYKEVLSSDLPTDLFENVDDYLLDGTLPNIARVWKYNDSYVIFEEGEHNLSILNKGKGFGIGVCKEVVDYIVNTYGYATFTWDCRIRNGVLIERLLKNYKEIDQWVEEDNEFIVSVKFTKGDDK